MGKMGGRGPVAQGLEQATHNRLVVGSKPTGPTILTPSAMNFHRRIYNGVITIFGGSNIFVTSNLASASFQISLPDSVGDGIPDWWRQFYFGGDGSTTNGDSCATCDADGTGEGNRFKYVVGLDPTQASSVFTLNITNDSSPALSFGPVAACRVVVPEFRDDLATGNGQILPTRSRPQQTELGISLPTQTRQQINAFTVLKSVCRSCFSWRWTSTTFSFACGFGGRLNNSIKKA